MKDSKLVRLRKGVIPPEIGEEYNTYKVHVGIFIDNGLLRFKGISTGAKVCLGMLRQHAGVDGKCFPSQEILATELGVSQREIIRQLKELEDGGFIIRIKPSGEEKLKHFNNNYKFLWHECFVR